MKCSSLYPISTRALLSLFCSVAIVCIAGCGGVIRGFSGNSSPAISDVSVSCNPDAIQPGQNSQCAAAVSGTGSYSSAVRWSATGGTITSAGVFTPSGTGTANITATSTQDSTKSGSAHITVSTATTASTITSVTVSCSPSSISTSQTSTCSKTVNGTGSYSSAVTWSATGGTITSTGVFTPSAAGTATITATSTQDTSKSGSTHISVTAATSTITSVTVSCSPSSIKASQTSTCSKTVNGTGSYSSAVTWSATGGTITSAGVFTPSGTGTATITATSTQDTSKSGSTHVTVTPSTSTITSVTVSCSPSSISTSQTSTCSKTVIGTGSYSSAVTWSATGGTITSAGVFTPSGTGTATVTATSTQDTSKSGSAHLSVTAAASTITSVTVSCSPSSITASQTSTCSKTVSGTGSYSSAVTWSATGGTITSAGVFTPSGTGTATVTATSTQDTSKSGSTHVTVTAGSSSTQYFAYGASITVGYTLNNPSTQAYPALVAAFEKVQLTNHAISGDQACDVPARQIFPYGDSPALSPHTVSSILVGTNDVDSEGTGPYESIYMLCDRATISWLGVPLEYKVLANGKNVATTGSGSLDNTWNSWTTAEQGATVSFTITTSNLGPIYAWPLIDDRSSATYSYALDGKVVGSGQVQTSPQMATQNGTRRSLGFIRIPAVSAGTHVITFTQTSTGTSGVSVVGVGSPFVSVGGQLPTVLVGTITYQWMGAGNEACTVTDAPCLQYIQDQRNDVTLLAGDGLDVRIFDTRQYMFGTASEMNDSLHPNALGQQELAHSVEDVW